MEGLKLQYLSVLHIFLLSYLWRKPTYKIRQNAEIQLILFYVKYKRKILSKLDFIFCKI